MNSENLNRVFRNYIEKFELMNDSQHNEMYKWVAVEHFQKVWNIEAPDFISMFKEAVSKSENLINNSRIHPGAGIIKLAEHDMEAVRELFRVLYKQDNMNLAERKNQIDEFSSGIKAMLDKYERGKWSYAHDMRTILSYLSFRFPDENYFYKPDEAKKLAQCMDYADDWGAGQTFKLDKYYRMCDRLVEAIKDQSELLALHNSRLHKGMFGDKSLHILAYDIIYCAKQYNLYNNIIVTEREKKPTRISINKDDDYRSREKMILHKQIDELNANLAIVESDKINLEKVSVIGKRVVHNKFGQGDVSEQIDGYIYIQFDGVSRRFSFPSVFSDKFLTIEDEKFSEHFTRYTELQKEEGILKMHIKEIELSLKKIL